MHTLCFNINELRILSTEHIYGIYRFISTLQLEAIYSAETFETTYQTNKR
jgi:hypothetical protein